MQVTVALVDQGHITAEQAVEAMRGHLNTFKPLGRLALRARLLNMREVMQILEAQGDQPDRLFGDLAIELGLLDPAHVETLLQQQQADSRSLSQVLVDTGVVTQELVLEVQAQQAVAA